MHLSRNPTLDEARTLYSKFAGRPVSLSMSSAQRDDALSVMAEIALAAKERQAGWGRLRLQALRELGRFLIRYGKGRGRPAKMSANDNLQLLAHLGITDRHISADAKNVARLSQTTFDTYLAQEDEPTLKGLLRFASAEQEPSAAADAMNIDVGSTNTEWYTPPEVFRAMSAEFDLDVASPGKKTVSWIPAKQHYTKRDDGLAQDWHGFVWMNAPFGLRNGMLDWIEKFIHHGNGVALVPDFTSTTWWQKLAAYSDCVLSVSPKIQFLPKRDVGINTLGSTLVAIGEKGVLALQAAERNGLGVCFLRKQPGQSKAADARPSTSDKVYTSPELAARIVEYFKPSGFCVDACAGRFAFYDALPEPKDWCELPDRDFRTYEFGRSISWICTNPPFSSDWLAPSI